MENGQMNQRDVQSNDNLPAVSHDLAQVPEALKQRDHWVCWRYQTRNGKPTKIPFDARSGREASSTDRRTWSSLTEVVHAIGGDATLSGPGFVFAEGDGFCGVDLDNAIDPTSGALKPWAERIVRTLDSYTEISPSGTGVKIFLRATKPGKRCRTSIDDGEIEIYDQGRYFTVTGRRWTGTPAEVEERQEQLNALYAEVFEPEQPEPVPVSPTNSGPAPLLSDEDILDLARGQRRTGQKFASLYDAGDWNAHFNSQSEADSSVVFTLTFYTKDPTQLDRLFRGSKLWRPKWDQKHGEQTYGQMTIDKALSKVTKQYQPRKPRKPQRSQPQASGILSGESGTGDPGKDGQDNSGLIALGEREPETGRVVLSAKRTQPTAEAFIRDFYTHPDGQKLYFFAGMIMVWRDGRFIEVEDAAIRNQIQPWLHDALKYIVDRSTQEMILVDFDANPGTVKQAFDTVCNHAYLEATTPTPSWLSGTALAPPDELLPCKSKLLHLPTGKEYPSTPRFFSVNALDYDPDPIETMPEAWFKFLEQVFGEDDDSVRLLQEWMGYCLVSDTSQQKMMLMVGPRRSGKGTIGRVIGKLIGEGNVCGPTTSGLAGNFGLQPLIGKSLAVVSDARFSGDNIQTVVERLLCISGEDALTIDRKHKTSVTMKLPTRFMFMTNELPRFGDASNALTGRFLILQMTKSFYGNEDKNLTEKLLADLPGILNWAIDGWKRLRERGHFIQPAAAEDAIRELEDLSSPVGAFVRDCCEQVPGARTYVNDMYDAYKAYIEGEGWHTPATKAVFGRDLVAAVPGLHRRRNKHLGYFYEGIAIKGGSCEE
jgi:putative DNA primase/helicase